MRHLLRRPTRAAAAAAAALSLAGSLALVGAPAAQAAFPGPNGKVYFSSAAGRENPEIYSMDPDGTHIMRITTNQDYDTAPVASPDGGKLAFLSNRTGSTFQAWTMNADGTGAVQLSTAGVGGGFALSWSPTGQVYFTTNAGAIVRVNADGTGLTSTGLTGETPTVSPDGTTLAYTTYDYDNDETDLWTAGTDGSNPVKIVDSGVADQAFHPEWAPDGTRILFTLRQAGQSSIRTINADGTNITTIIPATAGKSYALPQFSPDGSKIAYSDETDNTLYTANANGTGVTVIRPAGADLAQTHDWAVGTAPAEGADLAVNVADTADPVSIGSPLTDTVTVTNNGPTTATAATVTIAATGTGALTATPSQGSCTGTTTLTCTLGNLASGTTATVSVTAEPAATGTASVTATAASSTADPVPGNNADTESTTVNNALGCTIIGTPGNDTLTGGNGNDVICGLGGNDTIKGGNGTDTLYGGEGNDDLDGGNNNDTIYAGAGNDVVDGGNGDDILYGGDGDDIMGGGNGADYLYAGAGNDTNYGETLLGSLLYLFDNGDDHIYGGPGNDDLDGQNGNDTLIDTEGTDTMKGANGNDTIDVHDGAGGDTANGGLGNDTCTADTGDTKTSC